MQVAWAHPKMAARREAAIKRHNLRDAERRMGTWPEVGNSFTGGRRTAECKSVNVRQAAIESF